MPAEEEEYRIDVATLRKRADMSQTQLAEALGVSQATISAWERGAEPSARFLPKLARVFEVTIEELFGLPRP